MTLDAAAGAGLRWVASKRSLILVSHRAAARGESAACAVMGVDCMELFTCVAAG